MVSYVVNDGPRPVAAATKARVLDAIDKLGYRPNTAARSLITGRSDLIGLVVPDVENQYFATLAKAVEKAAAARGVRLVLGQAQPDYLPELVESLAGHQVDGIITATPPPADLIARTGRLTFPLVKLSLDMSMDAVPSLSPTSTAARSRRCGTWPRCTGTAVSRWSPAAHRWTCANGPGSMRCTAWGCSPTAGCTPSGPRRADGTRPLG